MRWSWARFVLACDLGSGLLHPISFSDLHASITETSVTTTQLTNAFYMQSPRPHSAQESVLIILFFASA